MRYRELQNITAPAAGECGPQRRIHRGRRPGIHEGNPLFKIRFQTIGDIHDTRSGRNGDLRASSPGNSDNLWAFRPCRSARFRACVSIRPVVSISTP